MFQLSQNVMQRRAFIDQASKNKVRDGKKFQQAENVVL